MKAQILNNKIWLGVGAVVVLLVVLTLSLGRKEEVPLGETMEVTENPVEGVALEVRGLEDGLGVGEERMVKLVLTTGYQVSGVEMKMNFDPSFVILTGIEVNRNNFNTVVAEGVDEGGVMTIKALNMKPASELATGEVEVASVVVRGVAEGKTVLTVEPGSEATRNNKVDIDVNVLNIELVNGEVEVKI